MKRKNVYTKNTAINYQKLNSWPKNHTIKINFPGIKQILAKLEIIPRALPINKSRKNKSIIEKTVVNNEEILANSQIAQAFNQHFVNVGKKLAVKCNASLHSFRQFLGKLVLFSMYLKPPRYIEVNNLIYLLWLHKSAGYDNVDAYFIRTACDVIALYLTQLCHYCFEFGIIPRLSKNS